MILSSGLVSFIGDTDTHRSNVLVLRNEDFLNEAH